VKIIDASRFDIRRGVQQMCDIYLEGSLANRPRHSADATVVANSSA